MSESKSWFQLDAVRDLELAREFITTPIGHHSPNLQRLLRTIRSGPIKGKYALLMTRPGRQWTLICCSGHTGIPPIICWDKVFNSLEQAEREVFRLRWQELTGSKLEF